MQRPQIVITFFRTGHIRTVVGQAFLHLSSEMVLDGGGWPQIYSIPIMPGVLRQSSKKIGVVTVSVARLDGPLFITAPQREGCKPSEVTAAGILEGLF